jgi:hypothetical protein
VRKRSAVDVAISPTLELNFRCHVCEQDENFRPASQESFSMARLASTSVLIALLATCSSVQAQQANQRQAGSPAQAMSTIPADSVTITHWYK